jgi:hypothetical protein
VYVDIVPGFHDFNYKLLLFVIYAGETGQIEYVRRYKGNYFIVHNFPCKQRFHRSAKQMARAWKALEKMGYIYNLDFECGAAKFFIRFPSYLKAVDGAR